MGETAGIDSSRAETEHRSIGRSLYLLWSRQLPPARLTWIALAALATYGTAFLGGISLPSLLLLPAVAALIDLAYQRARFSRPRFPDAALATGLFLTLLLPPTVSLLAGGAVTVLAVSLRHVLRFRGRPVFNPAAAGVVLGALLFATAPAWWVSLGTYGELLVLALGMLLLARSPSNWRLPATFFLVYGAFQIFEHFLFGQSLAPRVLLLGAIDPVLVFFGLFMLPEPRSAPSDPAAQPMYAALVALGAVFLPTVFPSLGILVGLLAGNVLTAYLRRAALSPRPAEQATGRPEPPARRASRSRRAPRWTPGARVGVGLLVFFMVGILAAVTYQPAATPSTLVGLPPSGGGTTGSVSPSGCTTDNANISSSTLSSLHRMLGPSVILSYDTNTGTVVFYDPVNQVTVTETDLYEDYGYAEFNGDDFATAGCSA